MGQCHILLWHSTWMAWSCKASTHTPKFTQQEVIPGRLRDYFWEQSESCMLVFVCSAKIRGGGRGCLKGQSNHWQWQFWRKPFSEERSWKLWWPVPALVQACIRIIFGSLSLWGSYQHSVDVPAFKEAEVFIILLVICSPLGFSFPVVGSRRTSCPCIGHSIAKGKEGKNLTWGLFAVLFFCGCGLLLWMFLPHPERWGHTLLG